MYDNDRKTKTDYEYNHNFDIYLQEQFSKNNGTKSDVMEYLSNDENFKNIPKELLEQGKSVVTSHPDIANNQLFIIEPNYKAYLICVEYKKNIRERELTEDEYNIIFSVYKS